MLILKRPWTQQPQQPVEINRSVWTGAVSAAILPSLAEMSVIGSAEQITGANANVPYSLLSPAGRLIGWRPNSSTVVGEYFTWSTGGINIGANGSMIAVISGPNISSSDASIEYGGTSWGLALALRNTTIRASYVDNPTTAQFDASITGLSLVSDTLYTIGLVKSGTTVSAYFNGRKASTTGGSGGIRRSAGSGFGYGRSGAASYGRAALVAITSEALADSAMFELLNNPWRLFEPRRIYIPTSAAAGAAPTITALSARLITSTSAQPRISYS